MDNISAFIDQNLRSNGHDAIPEIQALRNVFENNLWHKDQSVFNHTKAVVEALEKYTKNELLLLATLFHDVAKPTTFVCDEKTGMTMCSGHEAKGSIMMDEIGPRIGLFGDDLQYLKQIIKCHDLPHILVNNLLEKNDDENTKKKFFDETGVIAQDLLIHALADMEGSDLSSSDPELFAKRKNIIESLIKKCQ